MLIIGARGFAKELLEVIIQLQLDPAIAFYDDINRTGPELIFNQYPVITSGDRAIEYFREFDPSFALGIGGPLARRTLFNKFLGMGGRPRTVISRYARMGTFGNSVGDGCCVMTGVIVTSDVNIGRGCLLNLNVTVGHDSTLGDFCELSPGVHVSGHVTMGNNCNVGTGAVILPGVTLGKDVVIGAGSVVTRDMPDYSLAVGIPAKVVKDLTPMERK